MCRVDEIIIDTPKNRVWRAKKKKNPTIVTSVPSESGIHPPTCDSARVKRNKKFRFLVMTRRVRRAPNVSDDLQQSFVIRPNTAAPLRGQIAFSRVYVRVIITYPPAHTHTTLTVSAVRAS